MKRFYFFLGWIFFLTGAVLAQDKIVKLKIVETSDIHGNYYPYDFILRHEAAGSLARVYEFVQKERETYKDNLLLLDNGDILQGQPCAYYYNYIDTISLHLAAEVLNYMKYNAGNMGNHDVETGRAVFDRWAGDCNFPILGANIIDTVTGKTHFKPYEVLERDGVKIVVLGMITPAIPAWLSENLWSGLRFDDMEENKAFALLNEFNQTFVDTVRSSGGNNAKRHLLIAGYWTDIEKTCTGIENGTFKMPKDTIKDREILSVHYYTPWQFCTTNQQNTWGSKEEIKQMHDLIDQLDKTCVKTEIPVIVGITPEWLAAKGITALVLDIDNTLTADRSQELPEEVAAWLAAMRKAGVKLTIVSNGAEKRVRPFAEKLGLAYLYRAAKPLPFALMVAQHRMGVKHRQMAMVGDQLYADRMVAALYGIPGLMVIPRGPDLGAQVILKRKWEKKHWQKYYDRGGKTL